jgi:GNAT superfamily N-acetyltransferase
LIRTSNDVVAYLKTDPFKYVVHLKMLDSYTAQMSWFSVQAGAQRGVGLLLPAEANPFDAQAYPQAKWVALLAADGAEVADLLAARLPRDENLVFKLVDEVTRAAVLKVFPARRVTAYISYTLCENDFPADPQVEMACRLDLRLLPLFQENGYTQAELAHEFAQGAMSFSLFDGDEPLATCFVFPNYARIWEIGGVRTNPTHRRQGCARRVVMAALRELHALGRAPRYNVKESNRASICLAESLGMRPFVTTEHFLYDAGKKNLQG